MANIILGITASIAAYKAIDLTRFLRLAGHDVTIVLSQSAPHFISILTLKSLFANKVHLHDDDLDRDGRMLHIALAKSAELILIAPASASMIAKLAHGAGECLLSTLCLVAKSKIVLAPAMNQAMWANALVQKNINTLKQAGMEIIGPAAGEQACGDFGFGRMLEPSEIAEYCQDLTTLKLLAGKKIIITAGPTQEKIDPVRFLSNYSSGKMGYALAQCAHAMGACVTLISGPTILTKPAHITTINVHTAQQMLEAAKEQSQTADIFIGCAAVSDYRPQLYAPQKIKKNQDVFNLTLTKNPDIISEIKHIFPQVFCVGFAAETHNILEFGRLKFQAKNLDMMAINDVSNGQVFAQDDNELIVLTQEGQHLIKRNNKKIIAKDLLTLINQYFAGSSRFF